MSAFLVTLLDRWEPVHDPSAASIATAAEQDVLGDDRDEGEPHADAEETEPFSSLELVLALPERLRRGFSRLMATIVILILFVLFFAAAILVPGSHTAGWVYPTTFTGLRLLHSAAYAGLAIPHFWRAQVFSLGVACTCGSCNLMMREGM